MTHPYTADTELALRARVARLRRLVRLAVPAYREGLRARLRAAAGDVSLAAVVSMGTGGIGTEAAERLTAQAVALAAAIRAAARDKTPPSAAQGATR